MQSSLADQEQRVKWQAKREVWFSDLQETKEAAEALYQIAPLNFNPAAVYKTHKGKFVMGLLRPAIREWPPHEQAEVIYDLLGWEMVSCCDPLLGVWKDYKSEADNG